MKKRKSVIGSIGTIQRSLCVKKKNSENNSGEMGIKIVHNETEKSFQ